MGNTIWIFQDLIAEKGIMTQLSAGYQHFWPRGVLEFQGRRRKDIFFSFPTSLSLSPLIEAQLLRHSYPTLRLGDFPEELSGVSKTFPIPHLQQAPEDLQTITDFSKPMFMATLVCFSTLQGGEERSWPGEREAGCSRCYPSTAGASSLHGQGRNTAQLGKVVQGKLLL